MTEPINAPEAPETLPPAWQAAFKHSRFFRQLLGADPDVAHWLSEHADQPLVGTHQRQSLADPRQYGAGARGARNAGADRQNRHQRG